MKRHRPLDTIATALFAASLALPACKAPFTSYRISKIDLPQRVETLPNGLRVIVAPDPTEVTTHVTLRYAVGSAFDPKNEKGLAHLVEHLAFRIGDTVTEAPASSTSTGNTADTDATETRTITHLTFHNASRART